MAKKKKNIPQYGTVTRKGVLYYRTRILDADGKQVSLYGTTCEELYDKEQEARRQVAEIIFHREHPTVAEYCEKWLLMQSAKVSPATLKGYASNMKNYIIKPLGDMYMEEVTADDIRLALIPLSNKSESLHNTVNMLLKCIFYSAERSQLLEYGKRRETDPKERFADRPAGGSAAGNRQRTSAVSVYHDRLICRSAPRRSSRLAMGLCVPRCTHSIYLCAARMAIRA